MLLEKSHQDPTTLCLILTETCAALPHPLGKAFLRTPPLADVSDTG